MKLSYQTILKTYANELVNGEPVGDFKKVIEESISNRFGKALLPYLTFTYENERPPCSYAVATTTTATVHVYSDAEIKEIVKIVNRLKASPFMPFGMFPDFDKLLALLSNQE